MLMPRRWRRYCARYRHMGIVCVLVYLVVCVLLSALLDVDNDRTSLIQGFQLNFLPNRVFDPFGSKIPRACDFPASLPTIAAGGPLSQPTAGNHPLSSAQCFSKDDGQDADIQMDAVWDTASLGYPGFILSVTGWVDTIQVESWSNRPLTVIIMPHSHQDPGWKKTVDGYYWSDTVDTLNHVVQRLSTNPNLKFIWSQIIFLQRWWEAATNDMRRQFKRLVDTGQLEIVSGGWVMTDEATSHYAAMLDQLLEGHQWLKDTLNMTVKNSWAIDPFGHSSTMSYLIGEAGMSNMVIQRTHYAVKRHFAANRNLEFYWQQQWNHHGNQGVFCHMMPFLLYSIPHSCGPDRHVCCKFDFYNKNCFLGNAKTDLVTVTDENVAKLATELWEQLRKKSELYRSDVVLMPFGDDFRFSNIEEWNKQFGNLDTLIDYINSNTHMQMKIQYGTLEDYFRAVHSSTAAPGNQRYPTLRGDFLPYSDRGDQYWSGFYTSRPFYKHRVRTLQAMLRSAELLFTVAMLQGKAAVTSVYQQLETARRTLALLQHHDAITGTSVKAVVKDYATRLNAALIGTGEVLKVSMESLLGNSTKQEDISLSLTEEFKHSDQPAVPVLLSLDTPRTVVVSNPLGHLRVDMVHLVVTTHDVLVTDGHGQTVGHQVSPVWSSSGRDIEPGQYKVSFEVTIPAFGVDSYQLQKRTSLLDQPGMATITNYTTPGDSDSRRKPHRADVFTVNSESKEHFQFSNKFLTAVFSSCDGMLKMLHYHGNRGTFKADVHFVTYSTGENSHPFRDRSGAYIFLPDGVAQELGGDPVVVAVSGLLFTQVRAIYRHIVHIATLYHTSGSLGNGVHIENLVDISGSVWDNRELVMRIETSVADDQHSFCTDLNGFQMHRRRTRARMGLQGNFYPVTTMAMLEDKTARCTLVTTETHGMASLVTGWLEVVLDRRLIQDDWRGLNQGVTDNIPTPSGFFLMFEKRAVSTQVKLDKYMCLPTLMSDFISEMLNNAPSVFTLTPGHHFQSHDLPERLPAPGGMLAEMPCGLHVLSFRIVSHESSNHQKVALLILHRKGTDCGYLSHVDCQEKTWFTLGELLGVQMARGVTGLEETSVTGVTTHRIITTQHKLHVPPMEIKTYKVIFS